MTHSKLLISEPNMLNYFAIRKHFDGMDAKFFYREVRQRWPVSAAHGGARQPHPCAEDTQDPPRPTPVPVPVPRQEAASQRP